MVLRRFSSFLIALSLTLTLASFSFAAAVYGNIHFRRDTAAAFVTANPVLDQGEPAVETDTLKFKIGDGLTPWASLPYQPAGGLTLYGTSTSTLTIAGSGSITLTTQTGLGLGAGYYIIVSSTAAPTNYMQGVVTAYNTSTGVLTFTSVVGHGSGTAATWRVGIAGVAGPAGGSGTLPPGSYYATFAPSCPTGSILADGAAISRSTYANLYAAICPGGGTTCVWGSGDGTTTFNAPKMQGAIVVAAGQGNTAEGGGTGTNWALGATAGAEKHTLTTAEMPAHGHTITVTDPGHAHNIGPWQLNAVNGTDGLVPTTNSASAGGPWGASYQAFTGITATANNAGSGTAHSIMPPVAALTVCVQY